MSFSLVLLSFFYSKFVFSGLGYSKTIKEQRKKEIKEERNVPRKKKKKQERTEKETKKERNLYEKEEYKIKELVKEIQRGNKEQKFKTRKKCHEARKYYGRKIIEWPAEKKERKTALTIGIKGMEEGTREIPKSERGQQKSKFLPTLRSSTRRTHSLANDPTDETAIFFSSCDRSSECGQYNNWKVQKKT